MTSDQRKRFHVEARAAFDCENLPVKMLDDWRHAEVEYALGGTGKSSTAFDEMDLTRCLIHFRHLQRGVRLPVDEIVRLAGKRQADGLLESFRPLWLAVNPRDRDDFMARRHKVTFFEEIATLDPRERRMVRISLTRLAKQYPAQPKEPAPCTTS